MYDSIFIPSAYSATAITQLCSQVCADTLRYAASRQSCFDRQHRAWWQKSHSLPSWLSAGCIVLGCCAPCARACGEALNYETGQRQPQESVTQQHPCRECAQVCVVSVHGFGYGVWNSSSE